MLELNVTELVELLLIAVLGIAQDAERIEAAKGGLGSNGFGKISLEGGAGLAGLGRSKGGGAGQESRDDDTLHCCICLVIGLAWIVRIMQGRRVGGHGRDPKGIQSHFKSAQVAQDRPFHLRCHMS